MHPPHVRAEVLRLVEAGLNDCQISRQTGVPRGTVRDIRRPRYKRERDLHSCPCCWRSARPVRFTAEDYAELLGLYLGDGCISPGARTARLRITLDSKYRGIIDDARALLERCFPANSVGVVVRDKGGYVDVSVYSSHLSCLFPQHGPGKKHERRLEFEAWQLDLIQAAPWDFLRGCIRSDGCAFVNRTGPYEYLSYDFSNKSSEIVALFTRVCDLVGIQYRLTWYRGSGRVRINRRSSVERMVAHVGLKT